MAIVDNFDAPIVGQIRRVAPKSRGRYLHDVPSQETERGARATFERKYS
jgi:hypothetical protein